MDVPNPHDEAAAPAGGCSPLSRSALVELASLRPGDVVVGLGCGGCREAAGAALRVAPTGRVIMVLTRAEALAAGAAPTGSPRPLVVRGDVIAIGLRSAVADVVVSSCPTCTRADQPAMYRELHRLLKRGGRLVASEAVALCAAQGAAYRPSRGAATVHLLPEPELVALVRAAGFGQPRLLQRTAPYEEAGRLVLSLTLEATRA